jgi:Leu/Phe-tRNA-protein transferase
VREVTPEEWETSISRLKDSYQRIIELIKNVESWDNEDVVGGVLGILAHNAYHLGEIRQALCTLKA